jgi:hypothetical protein
MQLGKVRLIEEPAIPKDIISAGNTKSVPKEQMTLGVLTRLFNGGIKINNYHTTINRNS